MDGTAAGDQCVPADSSAGIHRPVDVAAGGLQIEYPLHGPLDHRPVALQRSVVSGRQKVVPQTGGGIGDKIGLGAGRVHRACVGVTRPPGAILALRVCKPGERAARRLEVAAHGQPHHGFDMVPGIDDAAPEPGQGARGLLQSGDVGSSVRQARATERPHVSFTKYMTTLLPMMGFNRRSSARVSHGACSRSQTSRR